MAVQELGQVGLDLGDDISMDEDTQAEQVVLHGVVIVGEFVASFDGLPASPSRRPRTGVKEGEETLIDDGIDH